MANERSLAIDVAYVGFGTPGDGVPAKDYKRYPIIHTGSVVFSFNEKTIKEFKAMGIEDPWAILKKKGEADSIELAIPSPLATEMQDFCGGTVDAEDKWEEPVSIPSITKSLKIQTVPQNGYYTEYIVVKGDVQGRLSQGPSEEDTDLLLVKVMKQAVFDSNGNQRPGFSRQVKPIKKTEVESITIEGTPKVGERLTAKVMPEAATGTYKWYRKKDADPVLIPNADFASYTPTAEDIGYTISVKFTGTDYYSGEVTSATTQAVVA